jgi:hypothetical protein
MVAPSFYISWNTIYWSDNTVYLVCDYSYSNIMILKYGWYAYKNWVQQNIAVSWISSDKSYAYWEILYNNNIYTALYTSSGGTAYIYKCSINNDISISSNRQLIKTISFWGSNMPTLCWFDGTYFIMINYQDKELYQLDSSFNIINTIDLSSISSVSPIWNIISINWKYLIKNGSDYVFYEILQDGTYNWASFYLYQNCYWIGWWAYTNYWNWPAVPCFRY